METRHVPAPNEMSHKRQLDALLDLLPEGDPGLAVMVTFIERRLVELSDSARRRPVSGVYDMRKTG